MSVLDAEITKRQKPREGAKMAYKKPQIVAKSAAKQSFVAGCPAKAPMTGVRCNYWARCECGQKT